MFGFKRRTAVVLIALAVAALGGGLVALTAGFRAGGFTRSATPQAASTTSTSPGYWLNKGFATDVRFVDDQYGWAALNAAIFATTVSGDTWNLQYQSAEQAGKVRSIEVGDRFTAWAVTETALLRTVDGKSWSEVTGPEAAIVDVDFADRSAGLGITADGNLTRTVNGGADWTHVGGFADVSDICAGDRNHLWVADHPLSGPQATIYRSMNGGETWERSFRGPVLDYTGLNCVSGTAWVSFGIVVAGPRGGDVYDLFFTADEGVHWTRVAANDPRGTVGGLPSVGGQPNVFALNELTAIFASGCLDCGEAGIAGGAMTTTHDGGRTFTPGHDIPAIAPRGISFVDPMRGWLAGSTSNNHDLVLRTTDGGETWETVADVPYSR